MDLLPLLSLLREAAEEILLPSFRLPDLVEVREKASALDVVTDLDMAIERWLGERLLQRHPGAVLVGEEAYEADPAILAALDGEGFAFILDPLDGTLNFVSGLPLFGVILAVVRAGQTVGGIILDPVTGDALVGERGAGAWLHRHEGSTSRARVAKACAFHEMTGIAAWPFLDEPLRSRLAARLAGCRMSFTLNCSAHEHWLTVTGQAHFLAAARTMPWDHAAGVLLFEEAGGHAATLRGEPYRAARTADGVICAPDRASWEAVRQGLFEISDESWPTTICSATEANATNF